MVIMVWMQPSFAYQETNYQDVMTKLESQNPALFKLAQKVYTYATTNTTDIIEKPLLTRHNKERRDRPQEQSVGQIFCRRTGWPEIKDG